VSFAAITLCVTSQRVFIIVYFVINSVRKLLDITLTYSHTAAPNSSVSFVGTTVSSMNSPELNFSLTLCFEY
jgi:hypothetical protein